MNNFYSGKTVLVTGSTWFKGSWLSLWLHELGAKVIGYALNPSTEPNLFNILKLDKDIIQVYADINNLESLQSVCDEYKPEIVFHLAAQPLVRESYRDPVWTFQTNVMGTVNMLETIRQSGSIKWAVLITTDKVYENLETMRPYVETDRFWWYDPYSASKAMDEIAIASYTRSFFSRWEKKIVSVRAWNVIWGGDWSADRLIPDMVRAFERWEPVILRNPDSVRPWQHVLEPLYGYLMMGEKMFQDDKYLGAYNFWPDNTDAMRVEDIVKKAIQVLTLGAYRIEKDINMHEAWLLLLDNTKSKSLLGWSPKFNVDIAIIKTFEWYKAFSNQEEMRGFTIRQIKEFSIDWDYSIDKTNE